MKILLSIMMLASVLVNQDSQSYDPLGDMMAKNERVCFERAYKGDYGSAILQGFCERHYNVPDAYEMKCRRLVFEGYPTWIDREACSMYMMEKGFWLES